MRHHGKTALITGAASGIGRAIAIRLAREGARIIIVDRLAADAVLDEIASAQGSAAALRCDLADPAAIAALTRTFEPPGEGCDILINNAGIYPFASVDDLSYHEWRHVMAVNLDAPFLLCKALTPTMRRRGWGRVINITSAVTQANEPNLAHYIASKMGLIGLTRGLAAEVGVDDVTVNAVSPGFIHNESTETGDAVELGFFESVPARQAVKRLGRPFDIVGVVSFLASDDASFITGQTLLVDGGASRL